MIEQIISNLIPAGILVTLLGFFIKKWMDNLETKINEMKIDVALVHSTKLDKTECDKSHIIEDKENLEVWNWLKYHRHTTDGAVIVPPRNA